MSSVRLVVITTAKPHELYAGSPPLKYNRSEAYVGHAGRTVSFPAHDASVTLVLETTTRTNVFEKRLIMRLDSSSTEDKRVFNTLAGGGLSAKATFWRSAKSSVFHIQAGISQFEGELDL